MCFPSFRFVTKNWPFENGECIDLFYFLFFNDSLVLSLSFITALGQANYVKAKMSNLCVLWVFNVVGQVGRSQGKTEDVRFYYDCIRFMQKIYVPFAVELMCPMQMKISKKVHFLGVSRRGWCEGSGQLTGAVGKGGWGRRANQSRLNQKRWRNTSMLCSTIWTLTVKKKVHFHNDGVPSPPPHPVLYLPGLPDYGFYSAPSDQRGGPCSFADYGSLGPQAAQMLHSEHATSACNSPLQHLHSPDQFKNPGLYMSIYLIHIFL